MRRRPSMIFCGAVKNSFKLLSTCKGTGVCVCVCVVSCVTACSCLSLISVCLSVCLAGLLSVLLFAQSTPHMEEKVNPTWSHNCPTTFSSKPGLLELKIRQRPAHDAPFVVLMPYLNSLNKEVFLYTFAVLVIDARYSSLLSRVHR